MVESSGQERGGEQLGSDRQGGRRRAANRGVDCGLDEQAAGGGEARGSDDVMKTGWWVATAVLLAATAGAGEPWSRWRGADGAGLAGSRQFPSEWTEADLAWTTPLRGVGHASPVIHDGRIFLASADEAAARRFVACHALADGRQLWLREIPGPIGRHHAQNSSASGSVAVDATGAYWMWAADDGLRVEALTLDGEPKWHVDLGPYAGEHGFGGSAAVCDDLVIVSNDHEGESFVVALDSATGTERWRVPRRSRKAGYATPLVVGAPGARRLVLSSHAHGITGIDPATGSVLWERDCLPNRAVSSPICAGPLAIATSGDGGGDTRLVAIRLPDGVGDKVPGEPEVAFELDRSVAPYVPTPLAVGERLYLWGDRGVVTCADATTGAIRWRGRVGGTFSASPIAVGGTIRNVSIDGDVVTLADGDAFEVLGRSSLGEECRATPAVVEGRMVFRTVGRLVAIDAEPAP
jgi:outer membrane protein assembly factor BamB